MRRNHSLVESADTVPGQNSDLGDVHRWARPQTNMLPDGLLAFSSRRCATASEVFGKACGGGDLQIDLTTTRPLMWAQVSLEGADGLCVRSPCPGGLVFPENEVFCGPAIDGEVDALFSGSIRPFDIPSVDFAFASP